MNNKDLYILNKNSLQGGTVKQVCPCQSALIERLGISILMFFSSVLVPHYHREIQGQYC